MEPWIMYALIAAILIAVRSLFTVKFTKKYSITEHLLHYYVICGIFIFAYAGYKKIYLKEKINIVDSEDLWKYALVAAISVIILEPCYILSMKNCKNPAQTSAIINLNTIFLFFMSLLFIKSTEFSKEKLFGIILTSIGVYFVI